MRHVEIKICASGSELARRCLTIWFTFYISVFPQRQKNNQHGAYLYPLYCFLLCFGNYPQVCFQKTCKGRLTTCASRGHKAVMPRPGSAQYVVKGFLHVVLIYEAVLKGSQRDGIKVRGEKIIRITHMFEGGVGGGVSSRLLHVLLPVKLRLFLHEICIWINKITCQSSLMEGAALPENAFHLWFCIQVAITLTVLMCTACCKSFHVMPLMFLLKVRFVHFACGKTDTFEVLCAIFFLRLFLCAPCLWRLVSANSAGLNLLCLMKGNGRKLMFW